MIIDPRTQRPVMAPADCHLIPESIKYGKPPKPVSNKTVALDGPFDNKIGEQCDHHLKSYLDMLVGDELKGEISFEGGAPRLDGTLTYSASVFRVKPTPSRKRWNPAPPEVWLRKALGMRDDGLVAITGFVTRPVHMAKARLSIVNSAFLVLYYLGRRQFGSEVDWARALLKKAVESDLDQSKVLLTERHAELIILLATENLRDGMVLNPAEYRKHYRPDADMPDGVLDDFPNRSVTEDDEALVVRLPYGKGLRGVVRFHKRP